MSPRPIPDEILLEALRRVEQDEEPVRLVAEELGFSPGVIYERLRRKRSKDDKLRLAEERKARNVRQGVEALRRGESAARVAQHAGVTVRTVKGWLSTFYQANPDAYWADHPPVIEPPAKEHVVDPLVPALLPKADDPMVRWLANAEDDGMCPEIAPHPCPARPSATHLEWVDASAQMLGPYRVKQHTCSFHPLSYELVSIGGVYVVVRTRSGWDVERDRAATVMSYTASHFSRREVDLVWLQLLTGMIR